MTGLELLAPAKNLQIGKIAIDCGADAVYIGGPQFGARKEAANTLEDIAALVTYAHQYYARVYVALNTLFHDDELEAAQDLIAEYAAMGVDALIIQDAAFLKLDTHGLPLFGSTQMFINTPEKAAFWEAAGLQRIILPRELTYAEIQQIRSRTTVDLEAFVHGALCVCFSGQCYMSYSIGNRSGNRGECAQPCRKQYALYADDVLIDEDVYALSIKDLHIPTLDQLISAGVSSFKIEGRLKDESYVKNIVSYYHQQLADRPRRSHGRVHVPFVPQPEKTFNRGLMKYVHEKEQGSYAAHTAKSIGERIGKISYVGHNFISIRTNRALHNNDGLCFFVGNELKGTKINFVDHDKIFVSSLEGLEVGQEIFRNYDQEFSLILERAKPERRVPINWVIGANEAGVWLSVSDGVSKVELEESIALEAARNPVDKPLHDALSKCGDTIFVTDSVDVQMSPQRFIPVSLLNKMRRTALDQLLEVRLAAYPKLVKVSAQAQVAYPETILGYEGNVLNDVAKEFYTEHGVTEIEPAAESGRRMKASKVMTTKHCLRYEYDRCFQEHPDNANWYIDDDHGKRFKLKFDCVNCQMEVWTI